MLTDHATRMATVERRLVEERNRIEKDRTELTRSLKEEFSDDGVKLPGVPNRGLGRNVTKIDTKELRAEKYSPASGVPIEPFLRRFEETIVAMEVRYDCIWDDQTCYRQLRRALLDDAELFVATEDVVPLEDQTYAKFRLRLARRFGQAVHQTKWQAAVAMSARMKHTHETYSEFAAALEKLGGIHNIEREHYTTCFKQGLNSMDRAQLPSIMNLSLAQCVYKLTMANGHDGKDVPGWVPANLVVANVAQVEPAPSEPVVTADVLAATVVKQLQDNFSQGRWKPRSGGGRAPTPGSNSEKSKQNKLAHIKCYGCQEFGHYAADCPRKGADKAPDITALLAMLKEQGFKVPENGQPDGK